MEIIFIIVALIVGGVLTWIISNTLLKSRARNIIKDAETEAKLLRDNKMLEVKEKYLTLKNEYEAQVNQRNARMQQTESRLKQQEMQINQQRSELQKGRSETDAIKDNLNNQLDIVEKRKQELEKLQRQAHDQLEVISGLSAQEAKDKLIESLKDVEQSHHIEVTGLETLSLHFLNFSWIHNRFFSSPCTFFIDFPLAEP